MSKIYVVGIGPGAYDQMTGRAIRALNESDVIIGYTVYLKLLGERFGCKELLSTPMRQERERCQMCFEKAREGKKVLLIDADPQGSLTASLGYVEPDELGVTLATIMTKVINEDEISEEDGILHHQENVALLPANIELSTLEVTMGNVMSREMIMKEYIDTIRSRYDYILIDCLPSLGMMTINALVSSDSVLIPVQAAYLPVKGLQQLIKTISMVKKRLNRKLTIEGILLTMVDFRTNYAKDIAALVQETYGSQIAIFKNVIPMSVKAAETSAEGISIYTHCPKGKVSMAYMNLTQEVMSDEK